MYPLGSFAFAFGGTFSHFFSTIEIQRKKNEKQNKNEKKKQKRMKIKIIGMNK